MKSVGKVEHFIGSTANGIASREYGPFQGVMAEPFSSENLFNFFENWEGPSNCINIKCFSTGNYWYCKGKECTAPQSQIWVCYLYLKKSLYSNIFKHML